MKALATGPSMRGISSQHEAHLSHSHCSSTLDRAGPRQGPPQGQDKTPTTAVAKEFQEIKKDKETANI